LIFRRPPDRLTTPFSVAAFGRLFLLERSMTVKEKLIACALAGAFILLVLLAYGSPGGDG
jgi:hypothetical protein